MLFSNASPRPVRVNRVAFGACPSAPARRFRRPSDRSTPSKPSNGAKTEAIGSIGMTRVAANTVTASATSTQPSNVLRPEPKAVTAGIVRPARSGSGNIRQANARSGSDNIWPANAGSGDTALSGGRPRHTTMTMPFCSSTRAIVRMNGWVRVAASSTASSTDANGKPKLPCDWHSIASTAPSVTPSLAPPAGAVRASWFVCKRANQTQAANRTGGTAISGRWVATAPSATAPDWMASKMDATLVWRMQSRPNPVTSASPAVPCANAANRAVMPIHHWRGP